MTNNGKEPNHLDLFDQLENGAPVSQEVLDSLKEDHPELFELLQKSNKLRNAKKITPDPFFSRISQIHVYYQLVDSKRPKFNPIEEIKYFFSNLRYLSPPTFSLKPVMTIFLALVLTFSVFVGGVQAADDARPGQFLYPVDLAIEDVRILLATNEQVRLSLRMAIAEERLQEAEIEFSAGHPENAEIALAGYEAQQQSIQEQLQNEKVEFTEGIKTTTAISHQQNKQVLTNLLNSVPPESQTAVRRAIQVSESLEENLPEFVFEPAETPSEVVSEDQPEENNEVEEISPLPTDEISMPSKQLTDLSQPKQEIKPQPTETPEEKLFVTVWTYSVNVHSEPNLESPVLGWLFQNQTFITGKCENGFLFIKEFSGWAAGTCFEPNPCGPPGSCSQIVD